MARRNWVDLLEQLSRDEHFARHNIVSYPFQEHVIRQWLKNHWEWLEVGRERNEELLSIWVDLNGAIDELPELEQRVVRAYAEGWRAAALVEKTGREDAPQILARGVALMVSALGEGKS